MKCPTCGYEDSKVIDSRPTENDSIRRRRECLSCHRRFTTYEVIDTVPVVIIKKDGSREICDRNKILAGILKACYKRPVTTEQINAVVDDIMQELGNSMQNEFRSADIGGMVMDRLRKLDEVAYVRFASVYREFRDVETFMREIMEMKENRQRNTTNFGNE